MVYDINNRATSGSVISGIRAWSQDGIRVDFNSVYLSETSDVPPTSGSVALYFDASNSSPSARNDILLNMRDDTPYLSTAIALNPVTGVSDYNDLHAGSFASACVGWWSGVSYRSLADWQGTGIDSQSISEIPHFRAPYLHVDSTFATQLNGSATPIAGITTDFDGQSRHATSPDIGADEIDLIVGVEQTGTGLAERFALTQNYPNPFNPSTTISYQLPTQSYVTLKVYDVLGRGVATLVDGVQQRGKYEVTWDAKNVTSGVHFYQLVASGFTSTKKLVLLR